MPRANTNPWEWDHKYSDKFEDHAFVKRLLVYTVKDAILPDTKAEKIPSDVPAFLRPLYNFPLLSREGEWLLFMKMNYCKYRATSVSQEIEINSACERLLSAEYAKMMTIAHQTRNDIADHNLRLVASFAKKQYKIGMTIEDWFSNGSITLLKAIDKYDCNRANPYHKGSNIKFSTYASWSILRNFYRDRTEIVKELNYIDYDVEQLPIADYRSTEESPIPVNIDTIKLFEAMNKLSKRERRILKGRFGIGGEGATLREMGQELKVSKERVRQIQTTAINYLKEVMAEKEQEELAA